MIFMSLAKTIKEKRKFLQKDNFFCIDMGLSDKEVACLRDIKIERELQQFNHYGIVDSTLENDLAKYFVEMRENTMLDIECISQLVARLSKSIIEGFEKESAWVMVRVSLPTDKYNVPRWHPDGRYFTSPEKTYKLVATLKGPQTLFAEKTDAKKFKELLRKGSENFETNVIKNDNRKKFEVEDLRIRKKLTETVKGIKTCEKNQAVAYLVGDENAVIHSEPKMNVPRIFISILSGSKEQIGEWKNRCNKK